MEGGAGGLDLDRESYPEDKRGMRDCSWPIRTFIQGNRFNDGYYAFIAIKLNCAQERRVSRFWR
jgi:hypothetical protein